FDTLVQGRLFEKLLGFVRHEVLDTKVPDSQIEQALKQLDLVTALSIFDDLQRTDTTRPDGMKWRHRSFLEFFAGCRLAALWQDRQTRDQVRGVLVDVHRVLDDDDREIRLFETTQTDGRVAFAFRDLRADWQWTLRFALGHAQDDERLNVPPKHRNDARSDLARELVALGNPWVVYEALQRDQLEFDADVTATVRWLVHRDWARRNYQNAVPNGELLPEPNPETKTALQASFVRGLRDSACLVTACEMLDGWTVESVPAGNPAAVVQKLVARFSAERDELMAGQIAALDQFLERFVPVPGGTFNAKRFHGDISEADWQATGVSNAEAIEMASFAMADFPVTNLLYECFDPGHHRWRNRYSDQDEQPAVWVNWVMTQAFCAWLTANDPEKRAYRLPTEWEWEWACRWQGTYSQDFWWGEKADPALMNYAYRLGRTNTRTEARERFARARRWHLSREADPNDVGLLDLHGNAWEWCSNVHSAGSWRRVCRGGAWDGSAAHCSSSPRRHDDAASRNHDIGLRLVRSA
ncbi:MAG: formylglycine-generating enzyme family protein, partial [Planctomycetes bacterium]|nr:formylglycine-generating enzyme family protein [Planctomycetota bacterium]